MIGTSKYSSVNIHNGIEASRRDDIESLCYTFIMLYGTTLPWSNINHKEYIIIIIHIMLSKIDNKHSNPLANKSSEEISIILLGGS